MRPEKADRPSRGEPTVIKARSHEATATGGRDNRLPEACREAIERVVSEPPGRNESERRCSLEKPIPGSRALHFWAKAACDGQGLAYNSAHSGGVSATARMTEGVSCDWRGPTHPREKSPEKDRTHNSASPGKGDGGGRASDGSVRAMRGGNALGAKGPC